ncbi:MAG: tandem-95 repeat protein, partial [Planctomycetales bacterium]|nr:tandem-95 repeat protein [Planctomycetales bacterium]
MSKKRFKGKSTRSARQIESLENRELLAGDLVAYWNASDHVAATTSNVESWTDNLGVVATTAVGVPQWAEDGLGGRPVIRFDAADGVDALAVDKADSPVAGANDFSVVVAFATASQDLVGGQAEWFKNSAIVDGSNGGFTQDWGISINASGQVTAGMGSDFLSPSVTVRSQATGLNNGQLQVATLTRSGGNLSLYVNDGTPSTVTGASTAARANLGISIGQLLTSGNGFTGDIGQIRIYDGQLSAAEVNQVYSEIHAYYNNQTPIANADQYQFEEDTFLGVVQVPGVLANDTDADGDSLTAVLVEDVKHGALGLNPNGSFSYAPEANFHGTDTFTYTANDFRASQPTTVTITVTNKYDAAVAISDSYKSLAGQVLNIPALVGVLANDINIDGATLTAELVQAPSAGSLTLKADGSFQYNPQGFAGSTSFQYRIFDGTGRSANASVQLVINTPPAAVNDSISIPEDSTLTLSSANGVLMNDVDAEGDALEITIITPPSLGSIEDNNGNLVYRPPLNYVGSDTFEYQLSDGVDLSNIATATLLMTPVNDAPTANDDTYFGKVDEAIVVTAAQSVLRNDTDIEGDALTASIVRQPTHGVVQFSSNGTFTYTPQAGFLGVDSFAYAASDGRASNQAEVKIAINSLAQQQQIVINEIHSDPNDKTNWVEFIELYNKGDQPVSLGGWVFTAGVDFTFPNDASIPAGGYIVVAQDAAMFQAEFDVTAMGQWEGTLRNSGERIELRSAGGDLIDTVDYKLGFPWPVVGEAPDKSLQLLNPEADNDLGGSWRSATPSPGVANPIRSDNIAPQMRQVEHSPQQPTDADDVTITVKVTDTDGVQNVSLEYQIVSPGNYISITDDAYRTTWTSVAMYDNGTNGDVEANDSIYTVVLPASLNQHRHLVRYRISAVDTKGVSV